MTCSKEVAGADGRGVRRRGAGTHVAAAVSKTKKGTKAAGRPPTRPPVLQAHLGASESLRGCFLEPPGALFKEESLHQDHLKAPPPSPAALRCLPACPTQKGAGEPWGSGAVLKGSGAGASAPGMPSGPFSRRQKNDNDKIHTKCFFIENHRSQWINSPRETRSKSSAGRNPGMRDGWID